MTTNSLVKSDIPILMNGFRYDWFVEETGKVEVAYQFSGLSFSVFDNYTRGLEFNLLDSGLLEHNHAIIGFAFAEGTVIDTITIFDDKRYEFFIEGLKNLEGVEVAVISVLLTEDAETMIHLP